jgi:hypothetical protein
MGDCRNCLFYRPARPASAIVKEALGTTDTHVAGVLREVQQMEQQQIGFEAQELREKSFRDEEQWLQRPKMFDYCARKEVEGQDSYLIPTIKNRDGRCQEYVARQAQPSNSCSTCRHRMRASGGQADRRVASYFLTAVMAQTQGGNQLYGKLPEMVGSRKADEARSVVMQQGYHIGPTGPLYFDYCPQRSEPGQYAVCAFINPHHVCGCWLPIGE